MAALTPSPITGVVTGQVGIGKSTLINNILSKDVTRPGSAKMVSFRQDLDLGTKKVQMFEGNNIFGADLRIFDTPGWNNTLISNGKIMEDICRETEGKVDFLYYCFSKNVFACDRKVFEQLTSKFTRKIWNHTIFVGTFCNEMTESPKDFEERMVSHNNDIRRALFDCGIPYDETKDILVVPAGDANPRIWQQGGKRPNWMEYLIEETCKRMDSTHTLLTRPRNTCTIS